MHVIATAGHVDHGKSALLHALTGMEPDRWDEEKRRGLTIDLGFVWTTLQEPDAEQVAFVDVPGHERFVSNMLAGVGPVPAVLFVVAADEGWMPQSAEHLAALHALGVEHLLLAVTKSDLLEPDLAAAEALEHLTGTLGFEPPVVAVSAHTGVGLNELRTALVRLTSGLPTPNSTEPVRLWIDRAFTIGGAGTVVTGTLQAGTIRPDDPVELIGAEGRVRQATVKGLHTLGRPVSDPDGVRGVARVAVNLRSIAPADISRGDVLATPGTHHLAERAELQLSTTDLERLPREATLHVGAASIPVRLHRVASDIALARLRTPAPLRVGDRTVLRTDRIIGGGTVLDVDRIRRRRVVHVDTVRSIGLDVSAIAPDATGGWLVEPTYTPLLRQRLRTLVDERSAVTVPEAVRALDLPAEELLTPLIEPPLRFWNGQVVGADHLPARALTLFAELPSPFTASEAKQALDTTRKVAIPLLEQFARAGLTRRTPDGRHELTPRGRALAAPPDE